MAELTFSRDEVEAVAEVGPWRLQRAFSSEIDPDDMGDTARAYQRAAGEAADTGELAEWATEIAEGSGGIDGRTVVDGARRDGRTAAELAGNGEDMAEVSRYLDLAMEAARQTELDVRALIDDYLDPRYAELLAAAEAEYQRRTNLSYFVGGERRTVEYTDAARPNEPELMSEIRDRYLRMAAEDAQYAHSTMTSDIADYRDILAQYGQRLDDLAYDVTAGPLDLWTTPGMASYAAERLKEALALGGDPELVDRYTATLGSMVDDVLSGFPTAGPRRLSQAEGRYLEEFVAALGEQGLADLGNLSEEGLSEDDARLLRSGQSAVGSGMMMLLNHDIRPPEADSPYGEAARAAVAPLQGRWSELFDSDPDSDAFREALTRYNGYGNLLGSSTVAPDIGHGRLLTTTALSVQERTNEQYRPDEFLWFDFEPENVVANTGSGNLLRGVAGSPEVASDVLGYGDFTERLLGQQWEDSGGVAELIGSGVRPPAPELDTRPLDLTAVDAVLAAADENEDRVEGTGPQNKYGHVDHSALQDLLEELRLGR
ncbi:hypothetical protein [Streptomyces mayteni]